MRLTNLYEGSIRSEPFAAPYLCGVARFGSVVVDRGLVYLYPVRRPSVTRLIFDDDEPASRADEWPAIEPKGEL